MASSKALKLENRFAREEVEWDQQFDVLNEGLQPDTQTPIESVVSKISELLPEGGHYSGTYLFFMVCFEVADQIPYNHPSMKKLAQIINLVLNSERLQTEVSSTLAQIALQSKANPMIIEFARKPKTPVF